MNTCAELFVNYLKSKEYNYGVHEAASGDVCVDFPYQGKVAKCIFSGDDGHYFSLYILFENVPADKLVDLLFVCNELNTQYKWATFYIDSDNDLMIHDDAILSVESAASEAMELLVRLLDIADTAKPKIMKALYA